MEYLETELVGCLFAVLDCLFPFVGYLFVFLEDGVLSMVFVGSLISTNDCARPFLSATRSSSL